MKICSKCKELKTLSNFGKDKRARDGLRSQCKECEKIYNRRFEENHREERRVLRRELGKRYRETHKDIEKARLQNWKKNNPDKYSAYHTRTKLKNRCRVLDFDKDITLETLYNRSDGICALCGEKCDYEDYVFRDKVFIAGNRYPSIDHIKSLSKGGSHTWDNVQLAHKLCNSIKSDKEA